MKLAIDLNLVNDVHAMQRVYQVTVISDKGLVFMHRNSWHKICSMLDECTQILFDHHADSKLASKLCLWNECFMVAYDKSEAYSCIAICNFELFSLCCRRCDINCVLLPTYDLISYVNLHNAYDNNEVLGFYVNSSSYNVIEVENN